MRCKARSSSGKVYWGGFTNKFDPNSHYGLDETSEEKNTKDQHTSCGAQNSVLEAAKFDGLETGSPDWAYSCFSSIAAWISMAPLDFPKNRYSLGLRARRLRLSDIIEASGSTPSFGVGTLSVVPRIAEVNVSMEEVGDAWMKGGWCIVTSGLGLSGARSLSIESWSSLKRVASGRSYGLV